MDNEYMEKLNLGKVKDLRDVLLEEIQKVRSGDSTPAIVNAITNASGKVFTSIKLELDYCKTVGITPKIDFIETKERKKIEEK